MSGEGVLRRLRGLRRVVQPFWALKHVSFDVARGETVGIIGHNGAGKSTILKVLSRITAPTSGEITIRGRLAALIEVGSGFHPDLTGRENVFLSGSILGMRRGEIADKLERIVEFAGVRRFIDTPVKRYSSGMYLRLGFSISAHLEAEILLLDEVLAVGDAEFQRKCHERITELQRTGTTIVFISHDLRSVERVCTRAILMHRGELMFDGSPRQAAAEYARITHPHALPGALPRLPAAPHSAATILGVEFFDNNDRPVSTFRTGERMVTRIAYAASEPVSQVFFEVFFRRDDRVYCQLRTDADGQMVDIPAGAGYCEMVCDELGMQPGTYTVEAKIVRHEPAMDVAAAFDCAILQVQSGIFVHGDFYMPHQWRCVPTHSGQHAPAESVNGVLVHQSR
jgi:ABC-type polysaccharide/polyol phosphate transport system ATPase subunit